MGQFYVCVLSSRSGVLEVVITSDLERRIYEHNHRLLKPDEKFCGECGATIGAPAPRAPSIDGPTPIQLSDPIPATEVIDGERKTVTAMFADIKGSVELMEDLDPEEARSDHADRWTGQETPDAGCGQAHPVAR